jgi:hypothetical protein
MHGALSWRHPGAGNLIRILGRRGCGSGTRVGKVEPLAGTAVHTILVNRYVVFLTTSSGCRTFIDSADNIKGHGIFACHFLHSFSGIFNALLTCLCGLEITRSNAQASVVSICTAYITSA